jgi:hypothetical protein
MNIDLRSGFTMYRRATRAQDSTASDTGDEGCRWDKYCPSDLSSRLKKGLGTRGRLVWHALLMLCSVLPVKITFLRLMYGMDRAQCNNGTNTAAQNAMRILPNLPSRCINQTVTSRAKISYMVYSGEKYWSRRKLTQDLHRGKGLRW